MAERGVSVYQDWITGEGLKKVCEWIRHGLSDEQIASNMGVSSDSFYLWQKEYPEFKKAVKKARLQPNIEIENAMFELACGRTYVEEIKSVLDPKTGTVIKVEKIRKQVPPSAVLLIFLAKNRMRDRYKDYAPTPAEIENTDEQPNVQIYLPDNGRDINDAKTAKRSAREIPVD